MTFTHRISSITITCLLLCSAISSVPQKEQHSASQLGPYDYCQAGKPSASSYKPLPDAKLEKVQVVVRHGDRTPYLIFDNFDETWDCSSNLSNVAYSVVKTGNGNEPSARTNVVMTIPQSNPFKNSMWKGTCDIGQLTAKGSLQHAHLGKELRKIYVDQLKFLPAKINDTKDSHSWIYARSTDYKRTQESARFLLGGLFGSSVKGAIRLEVFPSTLESMNPHSFEKAGHCPKLKQLIEKLDDHPDMKKFYQSTEAYRQKLRKALQPSLKSFKREPSMVDFLDGVLPRKCHSKALPCPENTNCLVSHDHSEIERLTNEEFTVRYGKLDISDQINSLENGIFFNELQAAAKSNTSARFQLYSGHDTTLHGALGLLKSKDLRWPPYASNIIFEYWRSTKDHKRKIRVLYNGTPLPADWCNFSHGCDEDVFDKYLKEHVPSDYQAACRV